MKKTILAFSALILSTLGLITLTPIAMAADVDPLKSACDTASNTQFCRNKNVENNRALVVSTDSLLVRIGQTVILITGAASVIMIIIGGFKYVISNGDSNGLQSAKNTILYALVGLVVAGFAQVMVSFVLSRFI